MVDCAFLIFTCFNEKLIAFKFLTKENNNRGLSQINTTKFFKKEDFLNILETIKNNFSELIENFCGVLEDNCLFQDLSSEENKEEVIIQIRELNMFKVLQEEVR